MKRIPLLCGTSLWNLVARAVLRHRFQRRGVKGRVSFRYIPLILGLLLLLGVSPASTRAQGCPANPGIRTVIFLPSPPNMALFPDYVGGQVTPWTIHIDYFAPCGDSTITVTSDNGQPNQPPVTLLTLPVSGGSSGTYDNSSTGGFPSPPPVGQNTPWTVTITNTLNSDSFYQSIESSVITLIPLQMSIQLSDNKIVSALGASTDALFVMNATPSTSWFPSVPLYS